MDMINTHLDLDKATIEEISKVIGKNLSSYAMVEYLLAAPEGLSILRKESEKLAKIELELSSLISRLEEKRHNIKGPLLSGTAQTTIFNLKIAQESLKKVSSELPEKIENYEKVAAIWSSDPEFKRAIESASRSHKTRDAALNEVLCTLSESLGGPSAVYKLFQKFPELRPPDLPSSFDIDSLRKRIERFKEKIHTNK